MLKNLVLSAFFAILTAVGGLLSIPTPFFVPFTMQTFVVMMSGLLLGPKYGPLSQILYIVMGLIGLPVFAGGTGGLHHVLSPTFGFLVGFVFVSWAAGVLTPQADKLWKYCLASLTAAVCLYVVALPLFYLNLNYITGTGVDMKKAFQLALIPFIVPDLLKALVAGWLAFQCVPMLRSAGLYAHQPKLNRDSLGSAD